MFACCRRLYVSCFSNWEIIRTGIGCLVQSWRKILLFDLLFVD